jgi:hypothetical protein
VPPCGFTYIKSASVGAVTAPTDKGIWGREVRGFNFAIQLVLDLKHIAFGLFAIK